MKKDRNLIKLSNLLLSALSELELQRLRQIQASFENFNSKCADAIKESHLFNAAVEKNWLGSADKIRSRISRNLNDFSYHLQRFKELINADDTRLPNLSDIFAELSQIEEELGEFNYDLKEMTISVITEPITLDNLLFGPFEIKLFINRINKLYTDSPYRVIALEPNPAGADDSVTHPHVSSESLCEGDGHTAIRRALEQGRLCDFFTMVVSILQTYNPDSPYISLEEWEGVSCYDCGYTIAGDNCYYCEYCDMDYCSECSTYCRVCETTICLGCACECPDCGERVCRNCTAICKECEENYCKDCSTKEGLCQNCLEQRKENDDEEQAETTEADTEVQSNGVG